jgi:lipopolysaccharide export LptBFGC system permease protein LptF
VVVLHGFAHAKIPVPISQLQSLFIVSVIVLAPLLAMVLLWMQFRRAGGLLLFLAMAGALVFGAYNHFIVVGADHISHVPPGEWGMLFRVTAILLALAEGLGSGVGVWVLSLTQQEKKTL